jgi:hypothetical protein
MGRRAAGLVSVAILGLRVGAFPVAGAEAAAVWPQFRGVRAAGVGDGAGLPDAWDGAAGKGILWKTRIPGLAHSSPAVWGEQVLVTTAVSSRKVGASRCQDGPSSKPFLADWGSRPSCFS